MSAYLDYKGVILRLAALLTLGTLLEVSTSMLIGTGIGGRMPGV
jgi:hypothetical protein